ncbi:MAG TPA: helix-turn-helix domain-containing protein [Bacilli bacterium]|nr:helix-turn-helix domain-containing protein [Bacilli bacterium]
MKAWKHLNLEQRKLIARLLSRASKLCKISDLLNVDATSIAKEIKRNRLMTKKSYGTVNKVCKHTIRYPYVCNFCQKKYSLCPFTQYRYEAEKAQEFADYRLKTSRIGIDLSPDEFSKLDTIVKHGIDNKQSIYHIVKSQPDLNVAVPTVYRYINKGLLTTKRIDLPYAVAYKKRRQNKMYDYTGNKIDRSNRTFLDYLAFRRGHPNVFPVQMDFPGTIRSDVNSILTITIPDLQFVLLFRITNKDAMKIVTVFNELEQRLGIDHFKHVFPIILTDRDPCFSDFLGIEFSPNTGEQRSHLFYCDSFRSTQKPYVENMNKQIRKFCKKGSSIDHLTKDDVKSINLALINTRVASLDGATPREAFERVYGHAIFKKLFE